MVWLTCAKVVEVVQNRLIPFILNFWPTLDKNRLFSPVFVNVGQVIKIALNGYTMPNFLKQSVSVSFGNCWITFSNSSLLARFSKYVST